MYSEIATKKERDEIVTKSEGINGKNNIIKTNTFLKMNNNLNIRNFLLDYNLNLLFQIVYELNKPKQIYSYDLLINYIEKHIDTTIYEILDKEIEIIKDPIFIIGCGHSGTSLFNKLLGHHTNIYSIPDESGIFLKENKINTTNKLKIFKLWTYICNKKGKKRWCEKTPMHVYYINDIFDIFPNAKIIILTRNGKAVSSSIKDREGIFSIGCYRWLKDNAAWIDNSNKNKCLVIKYEDIVRNTIDTFKKVCIYLDEEYEDLSNTIHNIENINLDLKPGLINGINHINLRKYQINQLIYDNIDEKNNKMNMDDQFIFDNIKYNNYTTTLMLQQLEYNL